MVEESAAATITPTADPPSEPSDTPAPDPALQQAAQGDTGREGDAAPPEGGDADGGDGGDTPDPAAQLTALAEHVKEREEAATKVGQDAAHKRMDGHLRNQTAHLRTVAESMPAIAKGLTALEKRARDGDPGAIEEYDELLTKHGERIDTFTGYTYHAGGVAGWIGLLGGLDDSGELAKEFGPRLQAVGNQDADPTLMADIKEAMTGAAKEQWEKTERPKMEAQIRKNVEAELRQEGRNGNSPPAAPKGGAGGGNTDNSDSARLDRLSGIIPTAGLPTDEDRAWLAARN